MDGLRKDESAITDGSALGDLTREGAASTFVRLFTSRHVADLRLLFAMIIFLLVVGTPLLIYLHVQDSTSVIGSPALVAGIIGVALGAVARLYQMGSVRLGIVDLFSCEIITICWVITVADSARAFVELYNTPPLTANKFTSEENYSPIFNSNAKDLENLEARVVERVTEFYTYLKAMRDYLRNLGNIEHPDKSIEAWHISVRSAIYMLFLMLESARKTVDLLVEYQPERALYNAEILLSEIIVYGFLWDNYRTDMLKRPEQNARFERLNLRRNDYQPIVKHLNELTAQHTGEGDPEREDWGKVAALLDELNRSCVSVFDDLISVTVSKSAARVR